MRLLKIIIEERKKFIKKDKIITWKIVRLAGFSYENRTRIRTRIWILVRLSDPDCQKTPKFRIPDPDSPVKH